MVSGQIFRIDLIIDLNYSIYKFPLQFQNKDAVSEGA
jgi:hypothetical protein